MPKAVQPEVTAGQIVFELDRFAFGEGDRLELSGRWFGVRGRRFVRPTLEVMSDVGRVRALADLEHKPWVPEDGERWDAAFHWESESEVLEAELSVAPDITVRLPAPGSEPDVAQRLSALPRGGGEATQADELERDEAAGEVQASPAPARLRARRAPRSTEAGSEVGALREQLAAAREEIDLLRSELAAAQIASTEAADAAATANMQLAAAQERRDSAHSGLQAAIAAHNAAVRARDELAADYERESQLRDQMQTERNRFAQGLQRANSELGQARSALQNAVRERQEAIDARDRALAELQTLVQTRERLALERDEAIASRGAALVMRNATRALPTDGHRAAWLERIFAIVLLVGVTFALLIVLHVL
jgi:predicted  nucleic acid-binding Zn-ribbon protein